MTLLLNVVTAWISVILGVLLSVIYLLRIINKGKKKNVIIGKINKKLRKVHIPMGIAFVTIACIHGFFSSGAILSLNFGTACMGVGLLLGLTYWLRKVFKGKCVWIKPHRWLTLVVIIFLGLHLWEIGGIMGPITFITGVQREMEQQVTELYAKEETKEVSENKTKESSEIIEPEVVVEEANLFLGNIDLKDGTYTGVGEGYGPDLTVDVTVSCNCISAIQVVSHNENNVKYYGKAIDAVPEAIIVNQNPVVDCVSGATYTSNGVMKAVIDALNKALISGELPNL